MEEWVHETDTFMVCMRLLLWNDLTANREVDKLRGCFMMKGHYDKGQSIISMVFSMPLFPILKEYKTRITQNIVQVKFIVCIY